LVTLANLTHAALLHSDQDAYLITNPEDIDKLPADPSKFD